MIREQLGHDAQHEDHTADLAAGYFYILMIILHQNYVHY